MEHLPVKEPDELQGIVPTGKELTLIWKPELGVGKSSLLDVRAATATYIDHVSATVEAIDPDAAPRVEVEETENDATGRHRGYVFHHYLPSGVAIDDVSIGTVSSLPAGSAPTAAIRDVSVDDETTDVDESKTHKQYKVDIGIPAPYDVDVDMTATVLNANEEPTAMWEAEHTNAKKQWHLTLALPKAKDVSVLPATILAAGSTPSVTDRGDANNSVLRFTLPAPWDVTLDLNVNVLDAGTPPTAQLIPSHSGNTKHWTLELGLSTGAQGVQGIDGKDGEAGHTPVVTVTAGEHFAESGTPSVTQITAANGDTTITLDYLKGEMQDLSNYVAKTGDQTMAGALTCNGGMLKSKLVATSSAGVAGAIWIA